jgi:gluconolactonase
MVEVFDERFASAAQGGGASPRLERLATGAVWSEGPVWLSACNTLLWSDIPNNRMLAWSAAAGLQVWREGVAFTNGHALERDGSLLHCSHGRRAIVRTRLDAQGHAIGADEIVVDRYEGKRLNSPNDVVVKRDGTIWFTDPPYGIVSDREGYKAEREQAGCYVFCFDPQTHRLHKVSDQVEEPNGLAFSPDEQVLYVSDTSAALRTDASGHHHIVAFDVENGRTLRNLRVFAVVTPGLADGFRVDVHGFIYTSSEDSVQIFHPDGTRLGRIAVPEKVGNLCFGGTEGNELFICASTSLYRVRLHTRCATAPTAP